MQYKAALTLGQLATNAVKLLPSSRPVAETGKKASGVPLSMSASDSQPLIGTGSRVMNRLRSQVAAHKDSGKGLTIDYLDRSLAQTQAEKDMRRQLATGLAEQESEALMSRSMEVPRVGFIDQNQSLTQTALQIGMSATAPAVRGGNNVGNNGAKN
jgi:hypothetical protein